MLALLSALTSFAPRGMVAPRHVACGRASPVVCALGRRELAAGVAAAAVASSSAQRASADGLAPR